MAVSIIKNGLCGFSIRIGSCQTCEISKKEKKYRKERQTEKASSDVHGSSGSHQKRQREETINYEYITDENRLSEEAKDGRRTGCQPFIRRYN